MIYLQNRARYTDVEYPHKHGTHTHNRDMITEYDGEMRIINDSPRTILRRHRGRDDVAARALEPLQAESLVRSLSGFITPGQALDIIRAHGGRYAAAQYSAMEAVLEMKATHHHLRALLAAFVANAVRSKFMKHARHCAHQLARTARARGFIRVARRYAVRKVYMRQATRAIQAFTHMPGIDAARRMLAQWFVQRWAYVAQMRIRIRIHLSWRGLVTKGAVFKAWKARVRQKPIQTAISKVVTAMRSKQNKALLRQCLQAWSYLVLLAFRVYLAKINVRMGLLRAGLWAWHAVKTRLRSRSKGHAAMRRCCDRVVCTRLLRVWEEGVCESVQWKVQELSMRMLRREHGFDAPAHGCVPVVNAQKAESRRVREGLVRAAEDEYWNDDADRLPAPKEDGSDIVGTPRGLRFSRDRTRDRGDDQGIHFATDWDPHGGCDVDRHQHAASPHDEQEAEEEESAEHRLGGEMVIGVGPREVLRMCGGNLQYAFEMLDVMQAEVRPLVLMHSVCKCLDA
jgi:hypothetical protein